MRLLNLVGNSVNDLCHVKAFESSSSSVPLLDPFTRAENGTGARQNHTGFSKTHNKCPI